MSLCNAAIDIARLADPSVEASLKKDKLFIQACWRAYSTILEDLSQKGWTLLRILCERFVLLDKTRDGRFVEFADFLSALKAEVYV